MKLIPAIDIMDGKCVRLLKGDYSAKTEYSEKPENMAKVFENSGADKIHVVDLDGAKAKKLINLRTIRAICSAVSIPVEVGGGIRTGKDIQKLLDLGVAQVIIGSLAVQEPEKITDFVKKFGADRIQIGIDVMNGIPKISGWMEDTDTTLEDLISDMASRGAKNFIITDISRDGTLTGPNFKLYQDLISKFPKLFFTASGGVSSKKDIDELRKIGILGAIIGKALYENKLDLLSLRNSLTKRIIPCLDITDGRVVKGKHFTDLRDAGDPMELAKKYSDMGADELVFLDITATVEKRKTLLDLVTRVGKAINIPFTVGGGIGELTDVKALLKAGADKVSIGSAAVKRPELIREIAHECGSQAVVVSIDAKKIGPVLRSPAESASGGRNMGEEGWNVFIRGGRDDTGIDAIEFSKQMQELGAGELLVNSLDRDGTKQGYDLELLKKISEAVNIPVIASSGAGKLEDFLKAFTQGKVDAVLAASLFHFGELTIPDLKQYLSRNLIPIRL